MKSITLLAMALSFSFHSAQASDPASGVAPAIKVADRPAKLATRLTEGELQREAYDLNKFPHFMKYIKSIDPSKRMVPTDPRNGAWVKTSQVFTPNVEMWSGFFKAAAEDHVTALRAF